MPSVSSPGCADAARERSVVVLVLDVLGASLLLVAGVSKLYAPQYLAGALAELFPRLSWRVALIVRPLALLEIAGGYGLLLPAARPLAAGVVVGLGVAFLVAGVRGVLRGSTLGCGCFARPGDRPLGWQNALAGLALALLAGVNFLVPHSSRTHRESVELSMTCTAVVTVLVVFWLHRTMIRGLLLPSSQTRVLAK